VQNTAGARKNTTNGMTPNASKRRKNPAWSKSVPTDAAETIA
jgi:hypothetical protein